METAKVADQQTLKEGQEQYLTFRVEGQEYGIEILKVQEIKGWDKITPIPNSPSYIKGVLNLRGVIVPVIDLRERFNLPVAERDSFTVIIVVNIGGRLGGIIVDAVSDVVNIGGDQQCGSPEFEGQENRDFIKGLAQVEGKLLILLNIDKIVNPDALDTTEAASPIAASA